MADVEIFLLETRCLSVATIVSSLHESSLKPRSMPFPGNPWPVTVTQEKGHISGW